MENRTTICSDNHTSRCIPKGNKSPSQRNICTLIYCNIIHSSKDKKTIYVPIDRWIGKENTVLYEWIISYTICDIYMLMLSCVWLSATPQTIAHQAPLSMEFSRQEYWSGLVAITYSRESSQRRVLNLVIFPTWGTKSCHLLSPTLAGRVFTTVPPGKPDTHTHGKPPTHTHTLFSLKKKKEILILVTTCISLKANMLNEISQTQANTVHLSYQFSSVAQSCPTLWDPMDCSTPRLPIHHQLPESTQTHVHRVNDAILPSHPLSSPSPPAFHLSQHQGLFKWVSSSHLVAKVLEFQL